MSLFKPFTGGLTTPVASEDRGLRPPPEDDFWYQDGQDYSRYNLSSSALCVSAIMACVKTIAESIAQLPLQIRKLTSLNDPYADVAFDHPLYAILEVRPNNFQTPYEWKELLAGHVALKGNAYCQITSGKRGAIDQLLPLNPDRMRVYLLDDNTLGYEYYDQLGRTHYYNQEEILHIRGFSDDGIIGLSPVEYASTSIGLARASETFTAAFYRNGGRPGGVLEHPSEMGEEAMIRFRHDWHKAHAGPQNAGKIAILEEAMKYHELGVTQQEAQNLETRMFQLRDIARIYRMQLHMIGDLEFATYSNVEHQSLDFLNHTLAPWLTRIEQAIRRDCIYDTRYLARFSRDSVLLGDKLTRFKGYEIGRRIGVYSPNDIRREEGRELISDPRADEYQYELKTPKASGNPQGDNTNKPVTPSKNGHARI